MQEKQRRRWLAGLLFLALAGTFLWCIIDNIILGAQPSGLANGSTVTAVAILGAVFWLVGHGIHGAAVIALPVMILRRGYGGKRHYGYR